MSGGRKNESYSDLDDDMKSTVTVGNLKSCCRVQAGEQKNMNTKEEEGHSHSRAKIF